MSKKATTTKQAGKTGILSPKRSKLDEQQLVQNVEDLSGSEVRAMAVAPKSAQQGVVAAELPAQAAAQEAAARETTVREADVVRSEVVLTAVQDGDHGGASLLIEAAAAPAAKEEKDDRGGAWLWTDWLAALGGVAVLASIKFPTAEATPVGASGIVFDTPVKNAIVFRDSNGNGKWDSGEAIAVTDSQGRFTNLGGSGNIVATSLDRLVARYNNADHTYTAADYAAFNTVSGLHLTSGQAIDIGADNTLGTADDFVWSGTYVAAASTTQGAVGVYVTAVSSLVTAYLAAQGINAPTAAQVNAAIATLKTLFAYDADSGVNGQGDGVKFYTSDLNGQITKIMGEAIAKAQAAGADVQQAVKDAIDQLAQAALHHEGAAGGSYITFDNASNKIDLTNVEHLQELYDYNVVEANALAMQTSNTGPAVYSVWFTEDGSLAAQMTDAHTYTSDGPIGNISVLSTTDGSSADLTVEPVGDAVALQQAHILVQAAGSESSSDLTLLSATGVAPEVIVQASGQSADAYLDLRAGAAGLTVDALVVNASGESADAQADVLGPVTLAGHLVVSASNQDASADAWFNAGGDAATVLGANGEGVHIDVAASSADASADVGIYNASGAASAIDVTATGDSSYASLEVGVAGDEQLVIDVINVSADSSNNSGDTFAQARLDVWGQSGDTDGAVAIRGNIDVSAGGSDDIAHLAVQEQSNGATVLGVAASGDTPAVGSDITVEASGLGSDAYAGIFQASGHAGQLSVAATGSGSAELDLEVQGDAGLAIGGLDVTASAYNSDAAAYIWGENEGSNASIAGDISVTASGEYAMASAELNDEAPSLVTLGASVYSGDVVVGVEGSNISVAATASSADATLLLNNGVGTIGAISVSAGASLESVPRHFIVDGGSDQYDYGNLIGNDFVTANWIEGDESSSTGIDYSTTPVSGTFGQGSQNVTVYQDSIFGMLVTGNASDTFNVRGNTGEDLANWVNTTPGVGTEDLITNVATYQGYNVIFYRTYGAGHPNNGEGHPDPSINRVLIYKSDATATVAPLDGLADSEDFSVSGLSGSDTLAYFVLYGDDTTNPISEADLTAFFHNAVDAVLMANGSSGAITDMQSAFYGDATQNVLRGEMGLYQGLTNDDDGPFALATLAEAQWTTEAYASADIDFNGNVQSDINVQATGEAGEAWLNLYSDAGAVNLQGGSISVEATASSADATANIHDTTGTISAVNVNASGESSDAYLDLSGSVTIQGDITISASGDSADATAWINASGLFSVGPSSNDTVLASSDITVEATGVSADASATIGHGSGIAGNVAVLAGTAGGAQHGEYQDFFLPALVEGSGWGGSSGPGSVYSVVVDGQTLSYTLIGNEGSTEGFLDALVASYNAQAVNLGLNAVFSISYWGDQSYNSSSLTVNWNDTANHDLLGFVFDGEPCYPIPGWYMEESGGVAPDWSQAALTLELNGTIAGNLDVLARGGWSDASATIYGDVNVSGDITVMASADDATATLDLNVGTDGLTTLNGNDIAAVAYGASAEATAHIENAAGWLGDLTVDATGDYARAGLDVVAAVDGRSQMQEIRFSGAHNALSALGEGDWVSLDIGGTWFEHQMQQSYYTSNADKLAEIVQAIRDDGDYADLGASVNWDGSSLFIHWADYNDAEQRPLVLINGNTVPNVHYYGENAVQPSLALGSSDVLVNASGAYTESYLTLSNTTGDIDRITVNADGSESANAEADLGFNGTLWHDVNVSAGGTGAGNYAALDLHASDYGRIQLGWWDQDVTVEATGREALAVANMSGLDGRLDLSVSATEKDSEADATLQFAAGSVNNVRVDAADHQSTVRVSIDQTEYNDNGSVDVAGQGHAALSWTVDRASATNELVDLSVMHTHDSLDADPNDWWGYADIDLVARWNDVARQAGVGLQSSSDEEVMSRALVVRDFNVERDSINVLLQNDADGDDGTQDPLTRHEIAFSSTTATVNTSTANLNADYAAAIADLLADARDYFNDYYYNNPGSEAGQGYYYREITVNVDAVNDYSYTRTFLVYDFALGGNTAGASGVIDLGNTTGLTERNVSDRYDIVSQTDGYIDQWGGGDAHYVTGVHAIDSVTTGAYDGGENYQEYEFDSADVMVSDITVEALNRGYNGWEDTSVAQLKLWATAACGDARFELRQSDINVIAHGNSYEDASADTYLSLSDAWGTLNSITVEANDSADASADLAYLAWWEDGTVKVHDVDVRGLGEDGNAQLRTFASDLTFDHSVVNVTAGYDALGQRVYASGSSAWLQVNGPAACGDVGYVDGTISELNVLAAGDWVSAEADFVSYAGDIDRINVNATGDFASASADVQFNNSECVNAVHEISVVAHGSGGPAWAGAYIHATDYSDIQLTGGDILVSATWNASADLDMNEVPVSGQVNQLVVEAQDGSFAGAWISGHDLSVTHERDAMMSTDIWDDSSIRVSAHDGSTAGLAIDGYGQYLNSVIVSAGESSDAYLSMDMRGFIDTLDLQVTGDESYVSADIYQETYGGVVNVSGSANNYPDDIVHESNDVDLAYHTATAKEIHIDNTGRDFVQGDFDDTVQLHLLLDVADEDIPYTSHSALLDYHRVQISGWTDNETISFNGEEGDANYGGNHDQSRDPNATGADRYYNYVENESAVSLSRLFSDANTALDGTVDYYFGVSGGNGYLFHDEDGTGITTVVELLGVTTFDYRQITGSDTSGHYNNIS